MKIRLTGLHFLLTAKPFTKIFICCLVLIFAGFIFAKFPFIRILKSMKQFLFRVSFMMLLKILLVINIDKICIFRGNGSKYIKRRQRNISIHAVDAKVTWNPLAATIFPKPSRKSGSHADKRSSNGGKLIESKKGADTGRQTSQDRIWLTIPPARAHFSSKPLVKRTWYM